MHGSPTSSRLLHDANDSRVFDSIVVVTDRRVLDRQLQTTMRQFEQILGVVENIDTTSRQLKEALESGKTIIVTTLQKFPVIANQIGELPGKRFAVIVDEAHSSQSGETTKSLKVVLAAGSLEDAEAEESCSARTESSSRFQSLPYGGLAIKFEHLEEQARFVQLADRVVEVELFQHLAHVRAEAGNVVAQVRGEVQRVAEQLVEIVAGRVVEGEAGRLPQLCIEVLKPLAAKFGLALEDFCLRAGEHAIKPPQHRQRKDHVLVVAASERVAYQIRDAPEEADDLAVIHGTGSLSQADLKVRLYAFGLFDNFDDLLGRFLRIPRRP